MACTTRQRTSPVETKLTSRFPAQPSSDLQSGRRYCRDYRGSQRVIFRDSLRNQHSNQSRADYCPKLSRTGFSFGAALKA